MADFADKKTLIIYHRINTLEQLSEVPAGCGVEIDIRGYGPMMLLNHDPISDPTAHAELEEYLRQYVRQGCSFIVFNMKETGYEQRVIDLAARLGIPKENYFLLDVEFPYIYRSTRKDGVRTAAVRYSEAEPLAMAEAQCSKAEDGSTVPLFDWVWVDTNTMLPLDKDAVTRLKPFKTCLVSPDRWGRPEDIAPYAACIKELGMRLDAVMSGQEHAAEWDRLLNG